MNIFQYVNYDIVIYCIGCCGFLSQLTIWIWIFLSSPPVPKIDNRIHFHPPFPYDASSSTVVYTFSTFFKFVVFFPQFCSRSSKGSVLSSYSKAASYSLNEKQVSSFRFLMNSTLRFCIFRRPTQKATPSFPLSILCSVVIQIHPRFYLHLWKETKEQWIMTFAKWNSLILSGPVYGIAHQLNKMVMTNCICMDYWFEMKDHNFY